MENTKNTVRLTGFVGRNPEIKSFGADKKLAKISIGIGTAPKEASGEKLVQWFTLVFWNNKVDLIEDLVQKGSQISIEGRLNTNTYTDKNNVKRTSTEVIVNSLELI